MDLYTMNENFLAKDPIDDFVSAIWTERYSEAGEVRLVVPANLDMITKLKEGTFLALRGTDEVMLLETQSIEDGLLTVAGQTLLKFLDERFVWTKAATSGTGIPLIVDYADLGKVGQIIADVVEKMVISPVAYTGAWANVNLDWTLDDIPGLELGPVDTSGDDLRITIPVGPIYQGIQPIAAQYGVGIKLYLESASPDTGYVIKFSTYRGQDHTSDGAFPLVRLVPDMDSLSDVKELRSIAQYKNVVYVVYQNQITIHYENPDLPVPEGFARRVLVKDADGQPAGHQVTGNRYWNGGGTYTYTVVDSGDIAAFRAQNARDALANYNYIRAIDGQTSPENDYTYGLHYALGDLIELEGLTGNLAKARVTEYIRTKDSAGERAYPTISVVD